MFLRYLTFCLDFFGRVAKWFDQKNKVNFKIYDVTAWLTNNCNTHIAQHQLIEYNMRIIFTEKWCTKCGGETSPRPFLVLNFYTVCFYCIPSWRLLKYIETKLQTTWLYLKLSFLKNQKGLELVFLPYFQHNFWRQIFLLMYSVNWPSFIFWLSLLREIVGSMCIVIVC